VQARDLASQEHRQQRIEMLLEKAEFGRTPSELVLLTIGPRLTGWCVRPGLGRCWRKGPS
jgi:hypothetical protein